MRTFILEQILLGRVKLAANVERIERIGNEYKILVGEPDGMKGDINWIMKM
jgi:hypothetical protein